MQITDKRKQCYGCGKCAWICPTGAIDMIEDDEGFLYPRIDEKKCVNCGLCGRQCISFVEYEIEIDTKIYACYAKEPSVVQKSTSGGFFSVVAGRFLLDGGIVYGAAFDNDLSVHHIRISDISDLPLIQGSKYVQSDLRGIFPTLMEDIRARKKVLFSGTGCQVAAIRSLAGNEENLCCVEVACMGCPSPGIWRKYIEEKKTKTGNIISVLFRDKKDGWETPFITYSCDEGIESCAYGKDRFIEGFGQALYLRRSCHECAFKGKHSMADLKIGDFWGISRIDPGFYNNRGTSVVIIQTKKGDEVYKSIREMLYCKEFSYNQVLAYNEYFEISIRESKKRTVFMEKYRLDEIRIDEAIEGCLIQTPGYKDNSTIKYQILSRVIELALDGKINDFFKANAFQCVAIYGMSDFGILLCKILQKAGVNICCLIDKRFNDYPEMIEGIDVIAPYEIGKYKYDCILVTAIFFYNKIIETLMVQGVDLNKVISVKGLWG